MTKFMKLAVWMLVLTVAVGAFAGDKSLTFSSATSLNGQKIEPGEYKVKYNVNGSTADVQILQNKKQVASAAGQVVENGITANRDRVVLQNNGDGTTKVVEIQFANQRTAIRFASDSASGGR
jgi:hypothetical protein